jgi:hypothetical protein
VGEGTPVETLGTVPATTRSIRWVGRKTVEYDAMFEDWAISGVPLRDLLAARWGAAEPPQQMTALRVADPVAAVAAVRRLLGESPPDFDDGRVALLVCPIDDDLDCGAVSAQVVTSADVVEWRDVGWQVTYQPFEPVLDEGGGSLSFRFDRSRYEYRLRDLLDGYQAFADEQVTEGPAVRRARRRWAWFRRR